jgi:hypothetical protein
MAITTFDHFMNVVDRLCWRLFGYSYEDLPDYINARDLYDAGCNPSDVINALAAELSDDLYMTTGD